VERDDVRVSHRSSYRTRRESARIVGRALMRAALDPAPGVRGWGPPRPRGEAARVSLSAP